MDGIDVLTGLAAGIAGAWVSFKSEELLLAPWQSVALILAVSTTIWALGQVAHSI